jgi:hypothetical protein
VTFKEFLAEISNVHRVIHWRFHTGKTGAVKMRLSLYEITVLHSYTSREPPDDGIMQYSIRNQTGQQGKII